MSVLHSELLNFTGSLCGIKMTSNEASMESKISHVWTVVKVSVKLSSQISLISTVMYYR
jgi:hypothetical protein